MVVTVVVVVVVVESVDDKLVHNRNGRQHPIEKNKYGHSIMIRDIIISLVISISCVDLMKRISLLLN
jgi:hypothetical protein